MEPNALMLAIDELARQPRAPAAPRPRSPLDRFLPRTDLILRGPVVVVCGTGAEKVVRYSIQHWLAAIGVGPSQEPQSSNRSAAVVPTQFVHAYGLERADAPTLLMRLAAPLCKIIDESDHDGEFRDMPLAQAWEGTSSAEARRRFAVCASAYGGVHVASSASDPEAWFHGLTHAVRCTHDTKEAFRGLVDACLTHVRHGLGLAQDPMLVVWIEGSDACGPGWIAPLSRAVRELAHERVAFVVDWPDRLLDGVERSCRDVGFDIVEAA